MSEKTLSHEESLQIIQDMIDKAKNKVTEDGFHFLLWGLLVISASLIQYYMIMNGNGERSDLAWIILPIIGVPAGILYEVRRSKKRTTQGHSDKLYALLWLGFCITLGLTIFVSSYNHFSPVPFILALVGMATFISGNIYRFTPLILGGIAFWIACIVSALMDGPEQLLINAGATFLGYILPGILLWQKSKQQTHVPAP